MPRNPQTILLTQPPVPMPPAHSYTVMQFRSTPNDDDDDICPVCESECTCGNTNAQSSTPQAPPTSAPTQLPLKIKLPPRKPSNPTPKPVPTKRTRLKSTKPKQTTAGSVTVDGTHWPGPFSALGHQLGAPPPDPPNILRDTSPLTPEPELCSPTKVNIKIKQPSSATTPKSRKKAAAVPLKTKSMPKASPAKKVSVSGLRNKKSDITSISTRSRHKTIFQQKSDDSGDNLLDDDVSSMRLDSDCESVEFPTFVSAISTTSGNDNDSASVTTDSFDSDCSVRAEEEGMILVEERAKVRREILNGEDSWHMEKRKWDHLKNNNNWEIRPRKKSVGAGETESEADTDTDSEVQEEEDEEEEADDDDPDIRYGRGMVTGWQSDDDDFDAELFFATLTDSSGPGSDADAEDGEESGNEQSDANSDLSTISITEAAAAGLLSSPLGASCPLVVTEDWDGRLVFANGLKDGQGVLDMHFEVNAMQRQRRMREAVKFGFEEAHGIPEGEGDDEDLFSDDDGETTDDMLENHPSFTTPYGVIPLPFRCPTPPVTSIDPLSTLSPITGSRRSKILQGALSRPSPKPAEILAGVKKMSRDMSEKDLHNEEHSAPASVGSPPGTATSSTKSRQMPSMGSFKHVSGDPKRSAVIDGSKKVVFSPFSRNRRARKHLERGRKRTAAGNDIFPYTSKRPRQSSLPDSNRALLPDESASPLVQSSPELPLPAAPIDLDDVLDSAFLNSDDSDEAAANTSGERHLRNLTRWDRIPMGTFRRSRSGNMDENSVRVSAPNDGVSYGSTGGHVLRKTPLGAALWQTNSDSNGTFKHPPGTVPVSPVIFPTRDGARTPTSQVLDALQKPPSSNAGPSKSRKQKRKEKKRTSVSASNASNNGLYHVPVNVPPLKL